jgi:hypothetical protein
LSRQQREKPVKRLPQEVKQAKIMLKRRKGALFLLEKPDSRDIKREAGTMEGRKRKPRFKGRLQIKGNQYK